jgi:hypothetical protein
MARMSFMQQYWLLAPTIHRKIAGLSCWDGQHLTLAAGGTLPLHTIHLDVCWLHIDQSCWRVDLGNVAFVPWWFPSSISAYAPSESPQRPTAIRTECLDQFRKLSTTTPIWFIPVLRIWDGVTAKRFSSDLSIRFWDKHSAAVCS